MTLPNYLYDGLINKTIYFTYVNNGSYSVGYKMEFMREKPEHLPSSLFFKMIPICDDYNDDEQFLQLNIRKKIYTSTTSMFNKEIMVNNHIQNKQ